MHGKSIISLKLIFIGFLSLTPIQSRKIPKIIKKLNKALDLPVKSERLFGFLDDIGAAVAGVAENAVDIAGNVGDIVANGVDIAGNVGDIVANGVGIAGNLADIGSNFKTIQTNEANILTNYDGIQALETMGSGSVWFDAYSIPNVEASGNYAIITYSNIREASSYSGAMDIGTGVFTAPLAGTYQFIIQAMKAPGVKADVKILMEGAEVSFIDDDTLDQSTITGTAIVDMQPGQKVWAETLYKLISGGWAHIHFTGVLITAE